MNDINAIFEHDVNGGVVAHLATNLIISVQGDAASCVSRCIAMLEDAKVGVSVHSDRLRRTDDGWRVFERIITMPPNLKRAYERASASNQ